MTTNQVAEVVRRLTKAQKGVLLAMRPDGWHRSSEVGERGGTMNSLWDRWTGEYGRSEPYSLVTRDVGDYPLGYIWSLTEEGLAVRAHLEASDNDRG